MHHIMNEFQIKYLAEIIVCYILDKHPKIDDSRKSTKFIPVSHADANRRSKLYPNYQLLFLNLMNNIQNILDVTMNDKFKWTEKINKISYRKLTFNYNL